MRQHTVTVIAATLAAMSISFAVAYATSPRATSSATDKAVVKELRKLNRSVGDPNRFPKAGLHRSLAQLRTQLEAIRTGVGRPSALGGGSTGVLGGLEDIETAIARTCRVLENAIGNSIYTCPS